MNLPLLNLKYPASADTFNEPMKKIASFDILDEYQLLQQAMYFPDVGSFSPAFE